MRKRKWQTLLYIFLIFVLFYVHMIVQQMYLSPEDAFYACERGLRYPPSEEIVLEFVDALEHNGQVYQAFFPAETEDEEEDPDSGLVILKVIREDGEDLLSTLDTEEELEAVYELFMELLFADEE